MADSSQEIGNRDATYSGRSNSTRLVEWEYADDKAEGREKE